MKNKYKLKEVDVKNRAFYYVHDIIVVMDRVSNFNFDFNFIRWKII